MIISPQGKTGGAPAARAVGVSPPASSGSAGPPLVSDVDPTRWRTIPLPDPEPDFESDLDPSRFRILD